MTYYSYTKMNLLDGFILAIVVFAIFYITSITIFKVFTLNYIFNWGNIYDKKVNDPNPKKEFIQPKLDEKINPDYYNYREQTGFYSIMETFKNINGAFFSGEESDWKKVFKLKFIPKLYFILLATTTIVSLLKLTVNYTINACVIKTVQTDIRIAPVGQDEYKPSETSIISTVLGMLGQYTGIALLFLIPTIYCYIAFNIQKFRDLNTIVKRIITLCVFIPILIYGLINLFSTGFFENDYSSTENNSKNFLKVIFNEKDYDFPESIYNIKNTFLGNYGIWFIVFIVFFIFEFKIINNMEIRKIDFIMKVLIIGLTLFAFSMYMSFKNYGNDDEEESSNDVFTSDFELKPEMYKYSVNNIKQAIIKYNYPCMPLGKE